MKEPAKIDAHSVSRGFLFLFCNKIGYFDFFFGDKEFYSSSGAKKKWSTQHRRLDLKSHFPSLELKEIKIIMCFRNRPVVRRVISPYILMNAYANVNWASRYSRCTPTKTSRPALIFCALASNRSILSLRIGILPFSFTPVEILKKHFFCGDCEDNYNCR